MMVEQAAAESDVPIACSLAAIEPDELPRHREVTQALFAAVVEQVERDDGYSYRLPVESGAILLAAEFIARERLCCPFYTFTLELAPAGGALWLRLTGQEGAKEVLQSGLQELLTAGV
jgi:hypothetical protein